MRKALNENPTVQLITIGVVGAILAFMLFSTVIKGEEAPATDTAATDPAATGGAVAPEPTAAAPPAGGTEAAPAPVTPASPAPPAETAPPPAAGPELTAGEGLPKDVLSAYEDDRTIALLVVDPDGISDRQVRDWTRTISDRAGVEGFEVDVDDVADYSRLTSGVGLNRTPALIVVQPRSVSGGAPVASVSYGFRSQRSIEQALDDAVYDAGPVTYDP